MAERIKPACETFIFKGILGHVWLIFGFFIIIAFLVGLAIWLVEFRAFSLWMAPQLARHSKAVAITLDILMTAFSLFSAAFMAIYDLVILVINTALKLFGDKATSMHPTKIDLKVYQLKPSFVHAELTNFVVDCAPMDSVGLVMKALARLTVGQPVCHFLRYIYPVPWLYDIFYAVVGWMSPDPTPLGYDGENNCEETAYRAYSTELCVGFGSGYIIASVVVPALLAVLFLFVSFSSIMILIFGKTEPKSNSDIKRIADQEIAKRQKQNTNSTKIKIP